jgi:uncharacterized cupin superfamily protein
MATSCIFASTFDGAQDIERGVAMNAKLKLPAIDPATVEPRVGSNYPEQFKPGVAARQKQRLGDALGLKNFGVNLTTIKPGVASALRHWHSHEDEFIYMVRGELVLVTDSGEQTLVAGMAAGFPAGRADGHRLVNRSTAEAVYLEVGDRSPDDTVTYPDDDLESRATPGGRKRFHKDGTPY